MLRILYNKSEGRDDMKKTYDFDGNLYTYDEVKKILDGSNQKNRSDGRWEETLKLIEGNRVLDFGCWAGATTKSIAQLGCDVIGIDYRPSAIDIANDFNKLPNITYEVRDMFSNPFHESYFDCIVFTEVIEHLENPALYLREFHRILKPGGFLILSTPNATSLKNVLYAISYRKQNKRQRIISDIKNENPQTGTHLEHLYNWDFPTLVRLLFRCGFDIYYHTFVRSGPIIIPFLNKKIEIIKRESTILKFIPTLMVNHLIKAQKPLQ